jgi:hypothetical protein
VDALGDRRARVRTASLLPAAYSTVAVVAT